MKLIVIGLLVLVLLIVQPFISNDERIAAIAAVFKAFVFIGLLAIFGIIK